MKKVAAWLSALSCLLVLCVSLPTAHADVNDFTVKEFNADYMLSNADPQGTMRIVERLQVEFTDNNHGILRALPQKYRGRDLQLRVNSVTSSTNAPSQYTTYKSNGNLVLKIGDPKRTVTGAQTYSIDYTVQNVIDFYDDHAELYWDINGDQWQQPFERVRATLHLAPGLAAQNQRCFTGNYGSSGSECTISQRGEVVQALASGRLSAAQTMTVVVGFGNGYFVPATPKDWLADHYKQILAVVLPPLLIGGWGYRRWHKHGKDPKGRGTIVPEYEAPDNLTPAEVAVIRSYKLDTKAVSATIIDLAIRKYLRIIETTQKKIFKDKKVYSYEVLTEDFSKLQAHERTIMTQLLMKAQAKTHTPTQFDELQKNFYRTVELLQKSLPDKLTKAGYFAVNPQKAGASLFVGAVVLLVVAFVFHAWVSLGLGIAAILLLIFASLMPKRSAKGQLAKDSIEGLKLYMNVAEKDRIKMLQSPDARYAQKSDAPKQTVELFEKLLPFAIVLGVEQQWAKQFEHLYTTPPDWYSGNWATFSAIYFASSLNNSISAMGTTFADPSSSSSSGLGGGGFSGGGGGGGGGGGW